MNVRDYSPFGSCDWGFNAPGVMLWWLCRNDGGYHIYREYKFREQTADQVATAVHKINESIGLDRFRYVAADPAMWQKNGAGKGESIAETLIRRRLPMRKADNDRFNGWMRLHQLLQPMPDGKRPWLTIDPACKYLIRTLPAQIQDKHDPDDLNTAGEDHAVDALRYGAMSRGAPVSGGGNREPEPGPGTWGAARREHELAHRKQGVLA